MLNCKENIIPTVFSPGEICGSAVNQLCYAKLVFRQVSNIIQMLGEGTHPSPRTESIYDFTLILMSLISSLLFLYVFKINVVV